MKNLVVVITDEADTKLSEVKQIKGFRNRADTVEWLIQEGFKQVVKEKVKESKS